MEEILKVKSIGKIAAILNCFMERDSLGVTEISQMLGLHKSTVFNLLDSLRMVEYLEQDELTGRYRLGLGIYRLGRTLGKRYSIAGIARPYMQELANQCGEQAYLAVPHSGKVLYLEAFHPAQAIHLMRSLQGETAHLYCTAIGKAMLAWYSPAALEEYLNDVSLEAYTRQTITDAKKLRQELILTRKRGYAIDEMEHEFGIKCVALPILDNQGAVAGAISVSGPSLRFEPDRIRQLALLLKTAATSIEASV